MLEIARGALILGPVGVGNTHLASALGHIAVRRRASVAFHRADLLFRSLKAARLDASLPAEMRRLTRVDLLVLDDFALQAMDPTATADFYELVVDGESYRRRQRPGRSPEPATTDHPTGASR